MRETRGDTVPVPPLSDDLAFLDIVTEWDISTPYHEWKPSIVVPPTFLAGAAIGRVIAVCNQKGGAGKTTTSLELAMALVARGLRVRIIDADKQDASLSAWLRYFLPEGVTIADAPNLLHLFFDQEVGLADVTYATPYTGLTFVPSFPDLDDVEAKRPTGSETALQFHLSQDDDADVTIIDCGPALGPLTVSALVAADDVLIPVQGDSGLDVKGAAALNRSITTVRKRLNPKLRVAGVVLTDFEKSSLARQIGHIFAQKYPEAVLLPVRTSVRLGESQLARTPLRVFAPGATTVLDYDRGAQLLLQSGGA
jgi:chromosome partitioning protein